MRREVLNLSAFNAAELAWLFLALLAYAVGDTAAGLTQDRAASMQNYPIRATYFTVALSLLLLGVIALCIAATVVRTGGLINLAALAYFDSLATRDLLLESKLFTGIRLALLCFGPLPQILGLLVTFVPFGPTVNSTSRNSPSGHPRDPRVPLPHRHHLPLAKRLGLAPPDLLHSS